MTTEYLIFDTRFGKTAIVYRRNPFILLRTVLPNRNKKDLMRTLEEVERIRPGLHKKALVARKLMTSYFNGLEIQPPWEWMEMKKLTDLQKAVLHATSEIPYGKTCSYGKIANDVGRPRAYRFVGTTLAINPFPVLIPCHRVIRSNGSIGQFGGGMALKKKMLELEKA